MEGSVYVDRNSQKKLFNLTGVVSIVKESILICLGKILQNEYLSGYLNHALCQLNLSLVFCVLSLRTVNSTVFIAHDSLNDIWDHLFSTCSKFSEKLTFLTPIIRTCTYSYQRKKNVRFLKKLAQTMLQISSVVCILKDPV